MRRALPGRGRLALMQGWDRADWRLYARIAVLAGAYYGAAKLGLGLATRLTERHQALRVGLPEGSHLDEILDTVGLEQAAATDHTVNEAVAALAHTE